MYAQARAGRNGIACINDPSPSCVCKEENINFWYGLRDCGTGKGGKVYTEIANWKDNTLCLNRGAGQPVATMALAQPTLPPGKTALPKTTVITMVEDGTTVFETSTVGRMGFAAPTAGV
jgi:hypothetical protein